MSMQAFIIQCTDQRTGRREERRIEAASADAAAQTAREQGYAVLNVRPEAPAAPSFQAAAAPAGGGRGAAMMVPIVLSGVALLAAMAALIVSLVGGGRGGLSKYSFSTPQNAVKSLCRIGATGDFDALIELEGTAVDRKKSKEMLESLKIEGEPLTVKQDDVEYKVVLYSIEDRQGKRRNSHMVLFKNEAGRWITGSRGFNRIAVEPPQLKAAENIRDLKDADVDKKVDEWEAKSR